ncbi:MAG: dihydrodipicolinate synthase family protein [Hyphomicrobiales bacterium]|nr:dihydrodipicolinate synthase family protein [Hyphomicrobiales bacterium]
MNHAIQGVHCAVATPIAADGNPEFGLLIAHCRALLAEGCHGLAPLGTTGEANSLGNGTRKALVEAIIDGGIPAEVLVPGTSTPAIADTIDLTRHAVETGAKGTVVLPPFYYKNPGDEGLYRYYSRVIEGVGDDRLRVVLYHIPQMSQVPISHGLIERLLAAYPGIVCGIKDSSGDIDNMVAMCERFPNLGVLAGADPLMLPVLQAGGAGCITATSNLRADALRVVWDNWRPPEKAVAVEAAQDRVNAWRSLAASYAQIPTTKSMIARIRGDETWVNVLPPHVELTTAERQTVWDQMADLDG